MKTIYDDIIERDFKIDSEGRTVFFAKGLKKPGYIIPDGEKKNEIRKIIERYSTALMTLFLVWFLVLKHSITIFVLWVALLGLIHFRWYRRKIDRAIWGLQPSNLKPKLDPANVRIGVGLIGIIAMFILFSGIILPIIVRSEGLKGVIVSLSLFFFILIAAIVGVYFLMIKKGQDDNKT